MGEDKNQGHWGQKIYKNGETIYDPFIINRSGRSDVTLRDIYAGMIAATLVAKTNPQTFIPFDNDEIAETAFNLADALLKRR